MDIHDTQLSIKDIILDGDWNLNALYTTIPNQIKDHILSLPAIVNETVPGCFFSWTNHLDGNYSARSGYSWLLKQLYPSHSVTSDWQWLWKAPVPEKIRILLWLTCPNSLPLASVLHHRNMLPSRSIFQTLADFGDRLGSKVMFFSLTLE